VADLLIGREREQKVLERALASPESEFVAVYGRRRVGKTFLIRHFFRGSFTFYASGLERGGTSAQLEAFHEGLMTYGSPETKPPATWMEAFRRLTALIDRSPGPGKKIIFLDELPWFQTPRSGFLTALEHFWNARASARGDVILIACGSATSWMVKNLLRNKGGLHNRVALRLPLRPFSLAESEAFYVSRGIVLTRYQMAEAHMVFGGVPYYLRQFDRTEGLAQNIDRLCFAPDAPLKGEYGVLLASLFGESGRHRQVIEALAKQTRGLTREELGRVPGVANGGGLTAVLEELELAGFVRRSAPFGAAKKGAVFKLADFFSLFHLAFMTGAPDEAFWSRFIVTPRHSAWAGYAFEQVTAAHIQQLKHALGIPAVRTVQSGWRVAATADGPGAQIDLVIDRDDGVINLCEFKYASAEYALTAAYAAQLRRRRELFREHTGTRKALHLTMCTPYGLVRNQYAETVQQDLSIDALFTLP
jgi:hypothetical protein